MDVSFRHYIAQLKERRPEIADFLLRCERNHVAPEDTRAMRNCVRSLLELTAGGHSPQLQKLARMMGEAMEPETAAARIDLISLGRALLGACHEALLVTPQAMRALPAFPPGAAKALPRKPLVLTVDDDRIIRNMIEAMFASHATILMAENGRQGLDMIRLHKPDAIVLDDAMPEMTGLKLLEHMHGDPALRLSSVIMLTSSDRPQDIERAMKAGAKEYVIKPFDPGALAEKLFRLLISAADSRF